MTIQEAIQIAVKNGWRMNHNIVMVRHDGETVRTSATPSLGDILLDPLFWQALGKGQKKTKIHGNLITICRNCEKESGANSVGSCDYCGCNAYGNFQIWHVFAMHRFIDHLIEGKSAESYFEKLQ